MGVTTTYQQTREEIEQTLGTVPGFMEALPEDDLVAEWPTFRKYVLEETTIPPKYRELIGLAVAANIKCPYCEHFHRSAAQLHGATDDELRELTMLASMVARWSAMIHSQEYDMNTFRAEVAEIGEHLQAQMESASD